MDIKYKLEKERNESPGYLLFKGCITNIRGLNKKEQFRFPPSVPSSSTFSPPLSPSPLFHYQHANQFRQKKNLSFLFTQLPFSPSSLDSVTSSRGPAFSFSLISSEQTCRLGDCQSLALGGDFWITINYNFGL